MDGDPAFDLTDARLVLHQVRHCVRAKGRASDEHTVPLRACRRTVLYTGRKAERRTKHVHFSPKKPREKHHTRCSKRAIPTNAVVITAGGKRSIGIYLCANEPVIPLPHSKRRLKRSTNSFCLGVV